MITPQTTDKAAADYVIGILSRAERAEVDLLRPRDAALNAAIIAWENKLAPLNETTPESIPTGGLFSLIERRIAANLAETEQPPALRDSARRWKVLALLACLALAILSGIMSNNLPMNAVAPNPAQGLVAVLQKETNPLFVLSVSERTLTLRIHALTPMPPSDRSYEVWLYLPGEKNPHILGIMQGNNARLALASPVDIAALRSGVLTVTLEPQGGSPTRQPTSPVIVAGHFAPVTM